MEITTRSSFTALSIMTFFLTIRGSAHVTETSKPDTTFFLCAEAFLDVYDMVCKLKHMRRERGGRRKRRGVKGEEVFWKNVLNF